MESYTKPEPEIGVVPVLFLLFVALGLALTFMFLGVEDLELMVTPDAARLEVRLAGNILEEAEERLDLAELERAFLGLAGVIVTPEVALPERIALVSIIVTFSFSFCLSTLVFADEAKAWRALGSSMVTT